jgi:hypothetical protein
MRILIYGGNKFVVRYRAGDWDIPSEILEDKYGLPLEDWAFGLGILENESFVILRRRQIGTANREYPYTVLLAPQMETWERFDWNAAKLIKSLLSNKNLVGVKLLESPESITSGDIDWLANKLPRPDIPPQQISLDIEALIAGSIFAVEPVAVNPSKEMPYPSLDEAAEILEDLPHFLRGGKGWLIGGNVSSAKHLGVNFVFNFQEQRVDESKIREIKDKGSRLIHDWRVVEEIPKLHRRLKQYEQTPLWLWEESLQQKPSEFFERLRLLAELAELKEIASDAEFFELKKALEKQGVLTEAYREVLLQLIGSISSRRLSEKETKFVLEEFERDESILENVPIERLNHETYCNWLIKNKTLPSQSKIPLQLDSLKFFLVCNGILDSEKNPKKVPALFGKLLEEFSDEDAIEWKKQLADIAYRKTDENWFEIWLNYRQERFFKEFIKPFCVAKARNQTRARFKGWEATYLAYGGDDGGIWLSENMPEREIWNLVHIFKNTAMNTGVYKKEATVWLQGLTFSPLRYSLTPLDKHKILLLSNALSESWHNFKTLWDIFSNNLPTEVDSAPPEEIPYLNKELTDFMKNCSTEQLLERADLLEKLFGELPPNIEQIVQAHKPKTGKTKTKEKEKEAALAKQAKSDASVTESDESEQISAAPIAAQAEKINVAQAKIAEEIYRVLSEENQRKSFLKDFWQTKETGWKDIFPLLPLDLRGEILLSLKQIDFGQTTETFLDIYTKSLEADSQTAFQHALWETLLYSKAKIDLRRKILSKRGRDRKVVEELKTLFNLPVEGKTWTLSGSSSYKSKEIADKEVLEGSKQWFSSIFQNIKRIFGYDESDTE